MARTTCAIDMVKPTCGIAPSLRSSASSFFITDGSRMSLSTITAISVEQPKRFSTVKSELGENFESYASAKEQLFDYIEVSYNQQRRHSALDYVSPAEYERTNRAEAAA